MSAKRRASARGERVAEWLGVSDTPWAAVATLAALAALTSFLLHGYVTLLPYVLPPLLVGASVGLCSRTRLEACLGALAGELVGLGVAATVYGEHEFLALFNSMPRWANRDFPMGIYGYFVNVGTSPTAIAEATRTSVLPSMMLGCVLAAAAALGCASLPSSGDRMKHVRLAAAWAVSVLLVVCWVASVWAPVATQLPRIRTEPASGSYSIDTEMNLKVFYLMHKGEPFYRAYVDAHAGDKRQLYPVSNGQIVRGSSAMFREPATFYLWQAIAPNGDFANVLVLATALGAAVMLLLFWGLSAVAGYRALFVAPVLYPGLALLVFVANPMFPEFWAMVAVLAAFAFLVRGHWLTAGLLGLLAVLFRETFGVWLLASALSALVLALGNRSLRMRAGAFAGLLGVGVVAYFAHVWAGSGYVARGSGTYLLNYLGASSAQPFELKLLSPLSYLIFPYGMFAVPPLLIVALGIAGLWVGLRRAPLARLTATGYVTAFVAYFAIMGAPSQYWGQAVLPLALIGATLLIASIDKLATKAAWTLTIKPADSR